MPNKAILRLTHGGFLWWGSAGVLIVAGAVLTYAIELQEWRLAQVASMVGVALIIAGVALLARAFRFTPSISGYAQGIKEEIRDKLLKRLVIVALFGLGVIFLYSVQYDHWGEGRVLSIASIGLIAAGAAWLTGALLGFLFGIPHTREDLQQSDRYKPSTSLEQISDWLTKIIVGVSLTQLSNIPIKLGELARYIASGMSPDRPNAFALGIVIFFSVCGFLFGFLWGRLYMLELFREADTDVERRLEKVERIIQSQVELDQHARNLVERQLDPRSNEVDPSELQETVQKASEDAKDEIVNLIKEARTGDDATDATRARAIPILGALIDLDVTGIEHRYHGQLGYFLLDLGQLPEAESELTKAMEIRDRRGKSGWNYYEYKRAVARIRREGSGEPSGAGTREGIVSDIRKALTDPKHRDTILGNREIMSWLKKNGVNVTDLEGGEPAAV